VSTFNLRCRARFDKINAISYQDFSSYIKAQRKSIECVVKRGTIYDAQLNRLRLLRTTEIATLISLYLRQ